MEYGIVRFFLNHFLIELTWQLLYCDVYNNNIQYIKLTKSW